MHPIAYSYRSALGVFLIRRESDDTWAVEFEGQVIGERYRAPQDALDHLNAMQALPRRIGDWNRVTPPAAPH
jgi:hypothetical protein